MAIVFKTPKSTLNTTSKQIQNLGGDCPPCPEPVLEGKELNYTQNGEYTVTPEQGVDGFSSIDVTVNVPTVNNQNKSVTITENGTSTVSADSGYSGLGDVTVEVNVVPTMAIAHIDPSTEHQTITPPAIYDGYASIEVNAVTNQIDSNIAAGNIKDGVTILGVTGNYSGSAINNQNKTVSPSTSQQSVSADSGYTGLGTVTVNAVTSSIDQNIAAGNIKNGVSILGVTGTYNPIPDLQAKTVNPSTSQQTVTPDQGKDGLSSVTVNAVTAAIDDNIQPMNILNGVDILGVTGENLGYDQGYADGYAQGQAECPEPGCNNTAYVQETITTNGTYTYDPSDYQGDSYDAFDGVEITVNVPSGGTNVPDWSSIGWTNQDVTTSGLVADVAYTATVKDNNSWSNNNNLVFAPKTSNSDSGNIFQNCANLSYVSDITLTGETATMRYMFYGCSSLRSVGNISAPNAINSRDAQNMFMNNLKLEKVGTIDMSNCWSTSNMFSGCGNLTSVQPIDMSDVTTVDNMFGGCTKLPSVVLTNTSGVASWSGAFANCRELTTLSLDISGATSLYRMFWNAFPRQSFVDQISLWDTSNITNFSQMFSTSSNGPSRNWMNTAPSFDMSSATDVSMMFSISANADGELETVPQYNWANVTNIYSVFGGYACRVLKNIGGFVNLGKAFVSTDASDNHLLDLSRGNVITKQSLMNIINNLAAPDDTNVNDATLKLSATSYALLDASDIAIATAKRWSVVSA